MFRPLDAAQRLRLIGASSIFAGLVLLALGTWCVTTLNGPSFDINTFAGARPTGRDFVLLVIEVATTLAGAYSLLLGIATLRKGQKQATFARSMHFVDAEFVADPKKSASGRCWQCGNKVRSGSPICYTCGAAQNHGLARRHPMQTDVLPETNGSPAPVSSGPLPPNDTVSPQAPASAYPQPPIYESGAQAYWELSRDEEPPAGDEPGPRTFYPWR